MSSASEPQWPSEQFEYGLQLLGDGNIALGLRVLENVLSELDSAPRHAAAECSYWLGMGYTEVSDFDAAATAFVRGVRLLDGQPPTVLSAECAAAAAEAFSELDRPADAARYFRSAAASFVVVGEIEDAAHCEEELGVLLYAADDHQGALGAFTSAAGRFLEHSAAAEAARCLHCAADTAVQLDEPQLVADYARRAFELGIDDEPAVQADRAHLLALAASELKDATATARAADEARRLFESECKFADAAESADLLGSALRELAEPESARAAFRQAYRWYLDSGKSAEAAQSLRNAADVAYELGRKDVALDEVADARRLFEAADVDIEIVYCTQALGTLHAELGQMGAASTELARARSEYEKRGMVGDAAECCDTLGDLLAETGKLVDALALLEHAATDYAGAGRHIESGDCHRRVAMIHMRYNDAARADASLTRSVDAMHAAGRMDLAAELEVARGALFSEIAAVADELAAYARARQLFDDAGEPAGVAWCDANSASVYLVQGELAAAETMVLGAVPVLAEADTDRAAVAHQILIRIYLEKSDFDAADRSLTELQRFANTPELIADAQLCDGMIRYHRGNYEAAGEPLRAAARAFESLGLAAKAAQCRQSLAMSDYFLGRHAAAEAALLGARQVMESQRRVGEVAGADLQLGIIYTATGRFDEAHAALRRSLATSRKLGLDNQSLTATYNIGALYIRQSMPNEALDTLRSARHLFGDAAESFRSAAFWNSLGGAEILAGHTGAGRPLVERALAFFDTDESFRWHVAACHVNIGLAHVQDRQHEDALASLRRAHATFAELGSSIEKAKCDLLAAAVLADRAGANSATAALADLTVAFGLAIPASIHVDSRRFQFAHAATRVSWSNMNLAFRSLLLQWAARAGDARLIADLVETSINAGTHTSRPPSLGDLVQPFVEDSHNPATDVESDRSAGPSDSLAAPATTLISGALLLMRPPPWLRMPGGHLALGPFIGSSFKRYGGTPPAVEVSVV